MPEEGNGGEEIQSSLFPTANREGEGEGAVTIEKLE